MGDSQNSILITDNRPSAADKSNFTGSYPLAVVESIIDAAVRENVDPYTALAVSLQENALGKNAKLSWGAWDTGNISTSDKQYRENLARESLLAKNQANVGRQQAAQGEKQVGDSILKTIDSDISSHTDLSKDPSWISEQAAEKYWESYQKGADESEEESDYPVEAFDFVNALKSKLEYGRKIKGDRAPEAQIIQAYNGYGTATGDSGVPINRMKNPVYGNQIIDLRTHAIKTNPLINHLVSHIRQRVAEERQKELLSKMYPSMVGQGHGE